MLNSLKNEIGFVAFRTVRQYFKSLHNLTVSKDLVSCRLEGFLDALYYTDQITYETYSFLQQLRVQRAIDREYRLSFTRYDIFDI